MNCVNFGISIISTQTPSAPAHAGGWSPLSLTNSEAAPITVGQVCYAFGNNLVKLAQSDGSAAEAEALYLVIDTSIAAAAVGRVVAGGVVRGAGAAMSYGALGFLAATAGGISATPNLTAGQYNVLLGHWINATDFQFNPQLPILN